MIQNFLGLGLNKYYSIVFSYCITILLGKNKKSYFWNFHVLVYVYVRWGWEHKHHSATVDIRGKTHESLFSFTLWVLGSNSDFQSWWQAPLPPEPCSWLESFYLKGEKSEVAMETSYIWGWGKWSSQASWCERIDILSITMGLDKWVAAAFP